MRDGVLVHGRASTYQRQGCRCDECRAAQTAATRAYRSTPKGRQRARELHSEYEQAKAALARRHQSEYRQILAAIRAGEVVE